MSGRYSPPEESTLGGMVRPAGARSSTRRGSPTSTYASALGSGFLGLGMAIVAALQSILSLAIMLSRASEYPSLLVVAVAWLLLMVTFLGLAITISATGERLPDWLYGVFLAALAAVVWLDFVAIADLGNIGRYASASVSAGFVLLIIVTLRSRWGVALATGLLGLAFVIAILVTTPLTPLTVPAQVVTLAVAIAPGVTGVLMVRGFERMLKRELDRVLVQSTVAAPRLAVGMLASEKLAQLDLDAEQMLDAVANGDAPLPLDADLSSRASALATELRLHLIEGRRETWLFHAVSESEHLGRRVTVSDPATLAGLLGDGQRDSLLAVLWLLAADPANAAPARSVTVSLGPSDPQRSARTDRLIISVRVEVDGLQRNHVDSGVWEVLDRVGRYSDSTVGGSVIIEVDCAVENPVDSARPR